MTITALLNTLNSRGLTLAVDGDALKLKGDEHAVTTDIITQVQEHKDTLLAVLKPSPSPTPAEPPNSFIGLVWGGPPPPDSEWVDIPIEEDHTVIRPGDQERDEAEVLRLWHELQAALATPGARLGDRLAAVRAGGIAVANLHKNSGDAELIAAAEAEGLALRIDRTTEWGNPYEIGKDGDRNQVCDKFEEYILGDPELLARLPELRGKLLLCWCHPDRCHGHTLARLAMQTDSQEGGEERLAMQAEARGEITAAETRRAIAEFDQLVRTRDYRDWRLEWLAEMGGLMLHYRDCRDDDVRQRLLALAVHTPTTEAEWVALGTTIRNALGELQAEGKLPAIRWPERGV